MTRDRQPDVNDLLKPIYVPLSTEPGTQESIPVSHLGSSDIIPRKYVLHKSCQRCLNCGTRHETSALYAYNELMLRTGGGQFVRNLVPVRAIVYNLEVEVISLRETEVSICHECVGSVDLSHLPNPRDTDAYKRIYYIGGAEKKDAAPTSRKAPAAKAVKTIDDLLGDL